MKGKLHDSAPSATCMGQRLVQAHRWPQPATGAASLPGDGAGPEGDLEPGLLLASPFCWAACTEERRNLFYFNCETRQLKTSSWLACVIELLRGRSGKAWG